nr:MAG TPA: hypothetical protein [Caudoviricetes sp.]
MARVIETSIEQLIPDNHNFNKGTQYGMRASESSGLVALSCWTRITAS